MTAPIAASVDLSGSTNGVVKGSLPAAPEPSGQEKQVMLHLSNVSHAVNHFQDQMMSMLYPSIMAELGLSYTAVGALAAVCSMLNSVCQGAATDEDRDAAFSLISCWASSPSRSGCC